jgi:hypothetical protein
MKLLELLSRHAWMARGCPDVGVTTAFCQPPRFSAWPRQNRTMSESM